MIGIFLLLFFLFLPGFSEGALLPFGNFIGNKHYLDLRLFYGCKAITKYKDTLSPKVCRFDEKILSKEFNLPGLYGALASLDRDGFVDGILLKMAPFNFGAVLSELSSKYTFRGCIAPVGSYYNRCYFYSGNGITVVVEKFGGRVEVLFVKGVDKRKGRLGGRP